MSSPSDPQQETTEIKKKRNTRFVGKWHGNTHVRIMIQEYLIKGYPAHLVHKLVNEKLEALKKPTLKIQTVYRYISAIKAEHSEWYLDILKDQMAYIILHRQKLLELDAVKRMVYDEIDAQKKMGGMPARTLILAAKTLHDIIETQSRLEKEIPNINTITAKSVKTPEEMQAIEASIVAGMDKDLQAKYEEMKKEQQRTIEKLYEQDPTGGNVNLSEHPEDTFVV